jgi:hypothetical protein
MPNPWLEHIRNCSQKYDDPEARKKCRESYVKVGDKPKKPKKRVRDLDPGLKMKQIRYSVYDSKSGTNTDNKEIKTKIVCKEIPNIKFNVAVFDNPIHMDKYSGIGWRLEFGFHDSEKDIYNNPMPIVFPEDPEEGYTGNSSFKDTREYKFEHKHFFDKRYINVSISETTDNPKKMTYKASLVSILTYEDDEINLHIDFVSVHKDSQGKGLGKQLFYLLFAYLYSINITRYRNVLFI